MRILICDKCKKELRFTEGYLVKLGDKSNASEFCFSYDLCNKCANNLKNWLNSAEQKLLEED